jgi:hypothetical protein
MSGCQYLGPEYDAHRHRGPTPFCGAVTISGKSYCHDHYYVVYKRGTSVNGRRREKEVEKEIAELKRQQELEEIENG